MHDFELIEVENGWYIFVENFIKKDTIEELFSYFKSSLNWESSEIKLFGKTYNTPRLEAFYSENNLNYSYSGKKLKQNIFDPKLLELKQTIEENISKVIPVNFNCVLANLYRNGKDSNGWHADNEKELGQNPIIASLSLGETRRFDLKHNLSKENLQFELNSGSLLVMGGEIQHYWKHQIAKSKKVQGERINLTFRKIIS
jgi:alkylated DNA repair dioxygenase AlkB